MQCAYRLCHGAGGTVFHFQRDIPPGFPFDNSGQAALTFAPAGNDRVEFPMAERVPFSNRFRPLANGSADIEPAPCLFGFLPFAFMTQASVP